MRKVADEVLGAVDEVKTKVEKLRSAKKERQKVSQLNLSIMWDSRNFIQWKNDKNVEHYFTITKEDEQNIKIIVK